MGPPHYTFWILSGNVMHDNARNHARKVNKPGLFCAEPNSPPVFVVVPNADVPNPPVVPKPVSVNTMSSR